MTVSVVVPVYNRVDHLTHLLASISRQQTQPDEVVVVDDGSLKPVVMPGVRVIRTENLGLTNASHAHNVGLRASTCDEIVRTDPEIEFCNDVIGSLLNARRSFPRDVISAMSCLKAKDDGSFVYVGGWAYLWMARREWLLEVGGWDEQIPSWGFEDSDVMRRLTYAGYVGSRPEGVIGLDMPNVQLSSIKIKHHWHPPLGLQGDSKAYIDAKVFPRDLIANRSREWGVPKE